MSCRLVLASCAAPGWMKGSRAGRKTAAASAQACTSSHNTVRAERGPVPRGRDRMQARAVLSHTTRERPAASPPLGHSSAEAHYLWAETPQGTFPLVPGAAFWGALELMQCIAVWGKYRELPGVSDLWLPIPWVEDHEGWDIRCAMRAKLPWGTSTPSLSTSGSPLGCFVQLRKKPSSTPPSSAGLPAASLCLSSPSSPLLQSLYVGIINHGYGAFV